MKIHAIADGGMKDLLVGDYPPGDVVDVIDLFSRYEWLDDDDGEIYRMQSVMILVHGFMDAHIEILSHD